VIVGALGLTGVVGFLVWVVLREPWGPIGGVRSPLGEVAWRRRHAVSRNELTNTGK
jgi:hypothetical protein